VVDVTVGPHPHRDKDIKILFYRVADRAGITDNCVPQSRSGIRNFIPSNVTIKGDTRGHAPEVRMGAPSSITPRTALTTTYCSPAPDTALRSRDPRFPPFDQRIFFPVAEAAAAVQATTDDTDHRDPLNQSQRRTLAQQAASPAG
jgi:hypothetical protein